MYIDSQILKGSVLRMMLTQILRFVTASLYEFNYDHRRVQIVFCGFISEFLEYIPEKYNE